MGHQLLTELKPEAVSKIKWKLVDHKPFTEKLEKLEYSNHGYCLLSNLWELYNKLQSSMSKKRFKLFKPWKTANLFSQTMFIRKPFLNIYNTFFLNAYSGGLLGHWEDQYYVRSWMHHIAQEVRKDFIFKLNSEELEFAWTILIIGYLTSVLCFLIEIFINLLKI